MRPSMASARASANDGTPRRGVCPEEHRRLRSLLCGPASARLPSRTTGRPSCVACSSTSLALAAVFCPRGAPFCCISTFTIGPALWWRAAARAMRTVCCSCRSIERSRRSRRRRAAPEGCPLESAMKSRQRKDQSSQTCLSLWCLWCVVVCVVQITEDTASQSWRVPSCTELNAAESKRHLNLQRQISGVRQAHQPTTVRGKRKGGTPSSILESPVPEGTNLFHRLGVGRPSPELSSRL